jgi:hypothetical protein
MLYLGLDSNQAQINHQQEKPSLNNKTSPKIGLTQLNTKLNLLLPRHHLPKYKKDLKNQLKSSKNKIQNSLHSNHHQLFELKITHQTNKLNHYKSLLNNKSKKNKYKTSQYTRM